MRRVRQAKTPSEPKAAPTCPNASKVGTDEIETPLLVTTLKGNVYVLQSNPPDLKLLVAASGEGVNLKLVGDVHLNETTGRLTTTFEETPELPFTDFKLSFSGGAQAALDDARHVRDVHDLVRLHAVELTVRRRRLRLEQLRNHGRDGGSVPVCATAVSRRQ